MIGEGTPLISMRIYDEIYIKFVIGIILILNLSYSKCEFRI